MAAESARAVLARRARVTASLLAASTLAACAAAQLGASDADLASARSRALHGAGIFQERCATCHGERGEGRGAAPPILGDGALLRYQRPGAIDAYASEPGLQQAPAGAWSPAQRRPELASALDLHGYLVDHMPHVAQGPRLSDDDYWAIVNFMLLAHGASVPDEGVASANAASVRLERAHP
jgi:cytochrome c